MFTFRLRAQDRRWWERLHARSPVELSPSVWSLLVAAYTSSNRHYHSLEHLLEMSGHWQEVSAGPGWQNPRASWLALLFHDAVQERKGPPGDDEARSAAFLAALLPDTSEAESLIRLTAGHGSLPESLSPDAAHFLDCDMAILGSSPARFARYERQIAAEYAPLYPPELFQFGRKAFLEGLLRQPRIYASEWGRGRWEEKARANLRRVLGISGE